MRFGSAVALLVVSCLSATALAQPLIAQNWQEMSPGERREAMRNYRQHSNLPEERQRDLEERYERFRNLSPEEQSRIRQNFDRFQQLQPNEREQFQRRYERWRERTAPRQ